MFFGRYAEWRSTQLSFWANFLTAIAYIICVQISYQFVNFEPSDRIVPLWLPSAFLLSLFFHFEYKILGGIIGGSILGSILVLNNFSPSLSWGHFLLLSLTFTLADISQPILANSWLKNSFEKKQDNLSTSDHLRDLFDSKSFVNPFATVRTTLAFIKAATIAPLFSACIGITALMITGAIASPQLFFSLMTWWLANALANLVFSPVLILIRFSNWLEFKRKKIELSLLFIVAIIVGILTFVKNYPLAYLYLPLVLLSVFVCGGLVANILVALVTITALITTAQGQGVFAQIFHTHPLIFLQSFTGILSLTALVFGALNQEREKAQKDLKKMIESLEYQVHFQTCELQIAQKQLEIANQELEKLANTDSLTQVANRRYFDQTLDGEWYRLLRENQPLSLLMLDVDYFKAYNDFYGHPQGDICLFRIAQILSQCAHRPADFVARYGGEEFGVVLPNTDVLGAIAVAENIHQGLKKLNLAHDASPLQPTLTVSIGIASLVPGLPHTPQDLVQRADLALYEAKHRGRNQYQIFDVDILHRPKCFLPPLSYPRGLGD